MMRILTIQYILLLPLTVSVIDSRSEAEGYNSSDVFPALLRNQGLLMGER